MKINFFKNSDAMNIICMALGADHHLVDKFNHDTLEHEVKLTVDGVELNFGNVVEAIATHFDAVVEQRAGEMYLERYDNRVDTITEELDKIAEKLKEIRIRTFPNYDFDDN